MNRHEPPAAAPKPPRPKRKQQRPNHLVVDAGPLREAAARAAEAAQTTLSAWVRNAIANELAAGQSVQRTPPQPSRQPIPPLITKDERAAQINRTKDTGKPLRLQLDATTAERLEAYRRRGNFRSRPAALRFALHAATTPEAIDVAPLKAAVAALIKSNSEIGPIGNNLNQIARALNTAMGRVAQRELDHLNVFMPEVQRHRERAARVANLLAAFITPHKPPKDTR